MATDKRGAMHGTVSAPACFVYEPVGPHALLSNYAHTAFEDEARSWRSVEHYYQAAKFSEPMHIAAICDCSSGEAARSLAWTVDFHNYVRTDWDDVRVDVMRRALSLKFAQHRASCHALASTWPQPIFENSPTDAFWGTGASGDGENTLGRLLEEVRTNILGLPPLYEVPYALRPPGRGGASETHTVRARWLACASHPAAADDLAYGGFETLDIARALERDAATAAPERYDYHAELLDSKYASYSWTDDARSAVSHWATRLKGILAERLTQPLGQATVLAVGAGSANECSNVWRDFGTRATLVDWGRQLARNCALEAPAATVLRRRAEKLDGIPSASIDLYCSLRTYDSALIDIDQALCEARRVLKATGSLAIISISDGYLTRHGDVTRGQIGTAGAIQRSTSWEKLLHATQAAERQGFENFSFFDLHAEIGFVAAIRLDNEGPSQR